MHGELRNLKKVWCYQIYVRTMRNASLRPVHLEAILGVGGFQAWRASTRPASDIEDSTDRTLMHGTLFSLSYQRGLLSGSLATRLAARKYFRAAYERFEFESQEQLVGRRECHVSTLFCTLQVPTYSSPQSLRGNWPGVHGTNAAAWDPCQYRRGGKCLATNRCCPDDHGPIRRPSALHHTDRPLIALLRTLTFYQITSLYTPGDVDADSLSSLLEV